MSVNNQVSVSASEEATPFFHALDLDPRIVEVLDKLNFVTPTPIQQQAIPVAMSGQDIMGIAQTGTGKTLAFGLPMLQNFVRRGRGGGRGLIVLPTRELALQVEESLQKIGKPFGLRTAVLIGGTPMRPQQAQLARNPDIIVATPGRLIDHMQQRGVDLRTVDTLVLDEADRMLDMGFAPQLRQIMREVPTERQTMLFSATMPDDIVKMANQYMHHPVRVEIARAGTAAERVTQELFIVPQEEKSELLSKVLYEYEGTVLVFTRTRSRARRVARHIRHWDHSAAEIHSDRTQQQRKAALDGFKSGAYRILVATDIAARGIDVSGIELVVNYDLPDCAEDYVHRIGRTGRAGQAGHAISFAAPDQASDVRDIEKVLRNQLTISEFSEHEFEASQRSSRGRGNASRSPQASRRPATTARENGSRDSYGRAASAPSRSESRGAVQADGSANRTEASRRTSPGAGTSTRPVQRGKRFFSGRQASPTRSR